MRIFQLLFALTVVSAAWPALAQRAATAEQDLFSDEAQQKVLDRLVSTLNAHEFHTDTSRESRKPQCNVLLKDLKANRDVAVLTQPKLKPIADRKAAALGRCRAYYEQPKFGDGSKWPSNYFEGMALHFGKRQKSRFYVAGLGAKLFGLVQVDNIDTDRLIGMNNEFRAHGLYQFDERSCRAGWIDLVSRLTDREYMTLLKWRDRVVVVSLTEFHSEAERLYTESISARDLTSLANGRPAHESFCSYSTDRRTTP